MTKLQRQMRSRRRRVLWGSLLFVVVGIVFLLGLGQRGDDVLVPGIGVFMVAGVMWIGGLFLTYTCPNCGAQLGQDARHSSNRIEWMIHLLAQPAECSRCSLREVDEEQHVQ